MHNSIHPHLLPHKKTGYNLRKRSHGLMLHDAKSSFLRNNFLVRMLYTDVYWHLSVFTLLFYVPSLRLSMTFSKETDDDDDDDDFILRTSLAPAIAGDLCILVARHVLRCYHVRYHCNLILIFLSAVTWVIKMNRGRAYCTGKQLELFLWSFQDWQ